MIWLEGAQENKNLSWPPMVLISSLKTDMARDKGVLKFKFSWSQTGGKESDYDRPELKLITLNDPFKWYYEAL